MPIEGLPGDSELSAKLRHLCLRMSHRGHCRADLGRSHPEGSTADPPSSSGGSEAGDGPLRNQLPLELSQSGENPENEFADGGGCVYGGTLSGENFQRGFYRCGCISSHSHRRLARRRVPLDESSLAAPSTQLLLRKTAFTRRLRGRDLTCIISVLEGAANSRPRVESS